MASPKKGRRRGSDREPAKSDSVARPSRRALARGAIAALAVTYLAMTWLNGVGAKIPEKILPRPLLFFVQSAKLFTGGGSMTVAYRAETWLCAERRWVEIDTRPHFPIDRDHKENRFHRALHFYRQNRPALQALEAHLLASHARGADDGVPPDARVGGVRFSRLRTPIPRPGQPVARWQRVALADHRHEVSRLYYTPRSKRADRCGGPIPTAAEDE
jgi:hypothetical protein